MEALRTEAGWIICGNCGHKLARAYNNPRVIQTGNREQITKLKIEFKCTSCKMINVWEVER